MKYSLIVHCLRKSIKFNFLASFLPQCFAEDCLVWWLLGAAWSLFLMKIFAHHHRNYHWWTWTQVSGWRELSMGWATGMRWWAERAAQGVTWAPALDWCRDQGVIIVQVWSPITAVHCWQRKYFLLQMFQKYLDQFHCNHHLRICCQQRYL